VIQKVVQDEHGLDVGAYCNKRLGIDRGSIETVVVVVVGHTEVSYVKSMVESKHKC
jgi:hypothetical protein